MKIIISKSLLFIACFALFINSNLLKKRVNTQDLELTLPADLQASNQKVKALADKQVAAARALLTNPNAKAKEILTVAATLLARAWVAENIKENEKNNENFNISINGGILTPNTVKADKNSSGNKAKELIGAKIFQDTNNMMQMGRISNVAKDNNPKPMDRAGVLATFGDIGTAIFDCPTQTKDKKLFPKDAKDLKENEKAYCNIAVSVASITNTNISELLNMGSIAKAQRGGSAIAPRKKKGPNGEPAERDNKMENGKMYLAPRSGLLTKTTDNSGFSASWPWQLIPKKYMTDCQEPWAGHYSGSIVEILFTLDLFTKANTSFGDDPLKSFNSKTMLDSENRRCKAALSAAFLLSIGYHSAIEVKPTIWAYLGRGDIGKNPEIFSMGNPKCDTSATTDIVALMTGCTNK